MPQHDAVSAELAEHLREAALQCTCGHEQRWGSAPRGAVFGNIRLTLMVQGGAQRDEKSKDHPHEISVELRGVDIAGIHLGEFRKVASEEFERRGVPASDIRRGMVVAELHPAGLRAANGAPIGARPEYDDETLRQLAGHRLFPQEWPSTTTSRNYRAVVGQGDLVVVAWSGNADYWQDEDRDRTFREFGDDRTLSVTWQTLGANTAMNKVSVEVLSIAEQVKRISARQSGDPDYEAGSSAVSEAHAKIREARHSLFSAVLQKVTGKDVALDSTLRRLGGLHEELVDELVPEKVTRELEQELDGLLHDVEFAMARRADDRLTAIVAGSEEAKRARFVQAVVVLLLAGAAIFTGIMTIPGAIWPETYPDAGLWAILIVLVSGIAGYLLYRVYQRPPLTRPWVGQAASALLVGAGLVAVLGVADVLAPVWALVGALAMTFTAAVLLAWQHAGGE